MNARPSLVAAALAISGLTLTACSIDVREHEADGKTDVDIRTLVGDITVRADKTPQDTGLPVYPGARVMRERGEHPGSADVRIGSAWFGLQVVAAKFESDEPQERILAFYRNELKAFGNVTECRGDVDFRRRGGARLPVCREKSFARDTQLLAGTEDNHRVVSVKPRASGTEFALVHLQMRGEG